MPTSTYSHLPTVVKYLQLARPNSILDIGLGNGKIGFIARDLLDVMLGERYRKEDWKIRIDGIEVFPDYVQDHQKAIYDEIHIGDAFEVIDTLGKYDLIFLGDVLEHFEKTKALQFLDKCMAHSNNYVVLCIPLGEKWIQPEIYGNPHEEHLSFWQADEFEGFAAEKEYLTFPGIGLYGSFLIKRDEYCHYRMREKAETLFNSGLETEAKDLLCQTLPLLPPCLESEYLIVDFHLRQKKFHDAVERLKVIQKIFPQEPSVHEYLDQLVCIAGK